MPTPRYAVVMKTHAWDGFVARQFDRYRDATRSGDLFLYLDVTNGPAIPPGLALPERVLRATNDDLFALGLSRRYEKGSLIWWNTDYPHYLFADRHPDYDYVLFVEYDTCCLGDIDAFVTAAQARGADLVALPTRQPKDQWMWTRFHVRTYRYDSIAGSLNCISLYSARALRHLSARRRAMSDEAANGRVPYWPGNEVFVATETLLAGYEFLSLGEFGNVDGFEWHPPLLEEDIPAAGNAMTFLHPVLDQKRYIASLLKFAYSFSEYFDPGSSLRRDLARFPPEAWRPQIRPAAWARLKMRTRERAEGVVARLPRGRRTG